MQFKKQYCSRRSKSCLFLQHLYYNLWNNSKSTD